MSSRPGSVAPTGLEEFWGCIFPGLRPLSRAYPGLLSVAPAGHAFECAKRCTRRARNWRKGTRQRRPSTHGNEPINERRDGTQIGKVGMGLLEAGMSLLGLERTVVVGILANRDAVELTDWRTRQKRRKTQPAWLVRQNPVLPGTSAKRRRSWTQSGTARIAE